MKKGKVYLIGAGPGDPGLISIKAMEWIRKADVIVYDQLANPIFLKEARTDVELIDVGKRAGHHPVPQSEINQILKRKAQAGNTVIRLKGGDPYVFGRGAEEAEILYKHRIPFEIVPGISSSIAAPAYAGIPVTHRECASTFAVITGHEDPLKGNSSVRWEQLATAVDTLVILMGVGNLKDIVQKVQRGGLTSSTPVALVQHGTLPRQNTITGTLKNIVEITQRNKITPPAIIIIGDVVKKRSILNWFETKPLFGRKIMVTRSRQQNSEFARQLTELGAVVIEYPTIEIHPLQNVTKIDKVISHLREYDWIIFTSVNGVEIFLQRIFTKKLDSRLFFHSKIAAIGPATRQKLLSYGLKADLVPKDEFRAESIIDSFQKINLTGKKILIARARVARDILPDTLIKLGADVNVLSVYETKIPHKRIRRDFEIPDMVTFTSSSTVENFIRSVSKNMLLKIKKNTKFASIGPITSQTAKGLGIPIHISAKTFTIPGLLDAILKYYTRE